MSTENNTKAESTYINPRAYYSKLQDYFDKMVVEGKCSVVSEADVIGKFKGMTYCFKEGSSKGQWAQLAVPVKSTGDKPTYYKEIDPKTHQFVKGEDGKIKIYHVFDAIASINGIENTPQNFKHLRDIAVKIFGKYDGKQIGDYDQKTDGKARDEKSKEKGLTEEEKKLDQSVREGEVAIMIGKMITEIEQTGTLYGTKSMQVPVRVHPMHIIDSVLDNNMRSVFPSRETILKTENVVKKTDKESGSAEWNYQGAVLTGLQYVAAMQDGAEDARYMAESDLCNVTGNRTVNGKPWIVKYAGVRNTGDKTSINWRGKRRSAKDMYRKDFGVRQIKDKDGNVIPREQMMLRCVYIDHKPEDHFTVQKYVNIANMAEKPWGTAEDEHSADETIYPRYPAKGTNKVALMRTARQLYGKCILDQAAFEKDPIGQMRQIITQYTKNHDIRNQGMRALQREMTLDRVLRRCGYQEGIEIPQEDRKAIIDWLKKDLENKQELGEHFINAATAMDKNNAFLFGASREDILKQEQDIVARPKFQNVQIAMQSDYRMSNGKLLPAGAGGPMSMPLSGENAYQILRDMCNRDKQLFSHPESEDYHKKVRFDLKLGDIEYKGISLSLGNLDTGNADSVADSLSNLITKDTKEAAYQREAINRDFGKLKALEEAGLLSDEFKSMDRVDFARERRTELQTKEDQVWQALNEFKQDEVTYVHVQTLKDKNNGLDIPPVANVFRYEIPTENKTLLYEALGTSNVIQIMEPDRESLQFRDKTPSLVVELRKPLEPLKELDENNQVKNRLDRFTGRPTFYDPVESRARATATLEAIPYLKGDEFGKASRFDSRFSVDLYHSNENGKFEKVQSFQGNAARDTLVQMAVRDEQAWQQEKSGMRSVYNMDTYGVVAMWNKEPVFKAQGRFGEKAFSNGQSIEAVLSSQKAELSEQGKAALAEMVRDSAPQQKYSSVHDLAETMKGNEPVKEAEIVKVLRSDKKVADLDQNFPRVERLEIEAKINKRTTESEIMDYIVDATIKEEKARTPEQMKQIRQEIITARPNQVAEVDRSLKRPAVQKKVTGRNR